jgi:hypothetical protein
MDQLWKDLRYGLRMLSTHSGFTLVPTSTSHRHSTNSCTTTF